MQDLYKAAHEHALLCEITHSPVYRLSGKDVIRYVHGRITQDVKGLDLEVSKSSLLLTPQGKILGHFYLAKFQESQDTDPYIIMVSDPLPDAASEQLKQNLLQFKVADQVEAESLASNYSLITVQGPESTALVVSVLGLKSIPKEQRATMVDWRSTRLYLFYCPRVRNSVGYDIIIDKSLRSELVNAFISAGATEGNNTILELLRIESARPLYGVDIDSSVLGPEIELADLVSFNKGCYVGQEVMEMATARGRPNRKLVLVDIPALDSEALIAGAALLDSVSESKVGTITSIAALPWLGKTLALAMVKTTALQNPLIVRGSSGNLVLTLT